MTMATVSYKQGIILERFWTALRLRRSKGSKEASNREFRQHRKFADQIRG
jgi:hypothetical protein